MALYIIGTLLFAFILYKAKRRAQRNTSTDALTQALGFRSPYGQRSWKQGGNPFLSLVVVAPGGAAQIVNVEGVISGTFLGILAMGAFLWWAQDYARKRRKR